MVIDPTRPSVTPIKSRTRTTYGLHFEYQFRVAQSRGYWRKKSPTVPTFIPHIQKWPRSVVQWRSSKKCLAPINASESADALGRCPRSGWASIYVFHGSIGALLAWVHDMCGVGRPRDDCAAGSREDSFRQNRTCKLSICNIFARLSRLGS